MKRYNTVDEYIIGNEQWHDALILLREILLSTGCEEAVKWGGPVYTFNGKNVAGMAGYKSYVGIWFFQGALLRDEHNKFMTFGEDKAKAMRQWRFNNVEEIETETETIVQYMLEAIENVKAGREIKPEKNKPLIIPGELQEQFKINPNLKTSFEALNLTQKREYVAYIGNAKRAETKQKRLDKSIPLILAGVGVMDKYR